jgi:hypothetical protein
LVLPCLILDWRKAESFETDSGGRSTDWVCDYKILLPVTKGDIRAGKLLPYVEKSFGTTHSSGPGPDVNMRDGELHMPYRDGVHAMRDAVALRLPLYVRFGAVTQLRQLHPADMARYAAEYPAHSDVYLGQDE